MITATGLGSMPGVDIFAATRQVLGTFENLGFLPELPARGVGAQMIGRTCAMLAELAVDLQPYGWRLTKSPDRYARGAKALLRQDLDALEETSEGYEGEIKISFCGPWSLAASLELEYADRVLADRGALIELAESLGEGINSLLSDLNRRLGRENFVVQIDEPVLPYVAAGQIKTASGLSYFYPVDFPDLVQVLKLVTERIKPYSKQLVMHCCASQFPFEACEKSGFDTASFDSTRLADNPSAAEFENLARWIDQGKTTWFGALAAQHVNQLATPDQLIRNVLEIIEIIKVDVCPEKIAITPSCGLAGWQSEKVSQSYQACLRAAKLLEEKLND